jgi:hypothetical protein
MGIEKTRNKLKFLKNRSFELLDELNIKDKFIYELTDFVFNRKN